MSSDGRGTAHIILPRQPKGKRESWDQLREDLRHANLHLTILGLTPEGRPHVKIVGTKQSLRRWLDGAGHWNVGVTS